MVFKPYFEEDSKEAKAHREVEGAPKGAAMSTETLAGAAAYHAARAEGFSFPPPSREEAFNALKNAAAEYVNQMVTRGQFTNVNVWGAQFKAAALVMQAHDAIFHTP